MKVRIKFAKYGALRFIGHLDVMRFFQKAIRRAEIDVAYSEGFSPHQIMSFAAPLGVGLCSFGEYLDVEIRSHQGSEDMLKRLQSVCVEGIEVLSVKALPQKAGNAMASVAAASYQVAYKNPEKSFRGYEEKLAEFFARSEIMITKETKRSTMQVNIRPGIYELFIDEEGAIVMKVDASSAGNIKPSFVTDAFFAYAGIKTEPFELQTTRLETYLNAGTAEEPVFEPLDWIGEEF